MCLGSHYAIKIPCTGSKSMSRSVTLNIRKTARSCVGRIEPRPVIGSLRAPFLVGARPMMLRPAPCRRWCAIPGARPPPRGRAPWLTTRSRISFLYVGNISALLAQRLPSCWHTNQSRLMTLYLVCVNSAAITIWQSLCFKLYFLGLQQFYNSHFLTNCFLWWVVNCYGTG